MGTADPEYTILSNRIMVSVPVQPVHRDQWSRGYPILPSSAIKATGGRGQDLFAKFLVFSHILISAYPIDCDIFRGDIDYMYIIHAVLYTGTTLIITIYLFLLIFRFLWKGRLERENVGFFFSWSHPISTHPIYHDKSSCISISIPWWTIIDYYFDVLNNISPRRLDACPPHQAYHRWGMGAREGGEAPIPISEYLTTHSV